MERLFIILAILIFVVAIVAVAAMAARGRREPLRMGSELDAEDEDLFIGAVGPRRSPIDRTAQILDQQVLDQRTRDPHVLDLEATELEPIRALHRTDRGAARRDAPEAGR
ncbi:hypothetical protein MKK69_06520 [Methylobacterium sp. J-026]|uniref:hypothetical protein n=1 Tax=Methylobacterium sp. J-026 TaxID=2836624 RepID=UPI001FB8D197|nr:hypothetical protein [Methylobacterium sp. J-026]MCJ2133727.1 hypothetical protein [Methylobacterium sp. J-026]